MEKKLLIMGGVDDFNMVRLASHIKKAGTPNLNLLIKKGASPSFHWDMAEDHLTVNGQLESPSGAFIRYDVFGSMARDRKDANDRSNGWYNAVAGWVLAHPEVKFLNRNSRNGVGNKPYILKLANDVGLKTPATHISNNPTLFQNSAKDLIAKPVAGGNFCKHIEEVLAATPLNEGLAATPAIVQECLTPPEIRIFIIGDAAIGFNVVSPSLDYRVRQDAKLEYIENPPADAVKKLKALMAGLHMDFGAADFKTSPDTKELVFLELNSSPMFAAFDIASKGAVCDAFVQYLLS